MGGDNSYLTLKEDRTCSLIILQGFLSKHCSLKISWKATFFFNHSQDIVTDTVTNKEAEFISKMSGEYQARKISS